MELKPKFRQQGLSENTSSSVYLGMFLDAVSFVVDGCKNSEYVHAQRE